MMEKLSDYNQKRNFEKTSEPEGTLKHDTEELRFVVQHHIARRDHYDLRLEWKGTMLSWAVPKGPSYDTNEKRLAIKVEDHPIDYRNFEGTIPKGEYGGGVVMIWDEGFWEPNADTDEGLNKGALKFVLKGIRLTGKWALIRLEQKDNDPKDNWILLKEKDEYAKNSDGISEFTTSVRTGRSMDEIEKGKQKEIVKNPFSKTDVQLAKFVNTIPQGEDWLFELKYDGYRIISYIENNSVRLISRNGKDYTKHFRDVANSLLQLANGRALIVDGEVTATDASGKTSFQALQSYIKNPKDKSLVYFVFDLLALDGEDLRERELIERKTILEDLLKKPPKNLHFSSHFRAKGKECFAAACQANMEGIVGKKAYSVYSGKRNSDWVKIKCDNRQEFVVGGYTLSDKRTSGVSSILVGVYEGDDLIFYGRAGSGIAESEMKMLEQKFLKIKRKDCPFKNVPKMRTNEEIIWLQPELVAEIKYAEITEDNLLRQASYKGIRMDKKAKDIKFEKAEEIFTADEGYEEEEIMGDKASDIPKEIKITNPDKVIFVQPKTTKADVIQYYLKVSKHILQYLDSRILSIVRCPKGVSEACFYKKHPGPGSKGIFTIPLPNGDKDREDFFYIKDEIGLINEAQMGTLEFHIWGSRVEQLEKPDIMVFDLDPDEGMDIDRVRQGVEDLKTVLNELSLKSYLKTSGGKGYHVVVPFKPSASWDKFHDFAKSIAQIMELRWPDRYTSNMRKVKRANKIFIDWVRNARGATSVAPYSLRAREGAGVSMPIAWDELYSIAPDGINMMKALERMEKKDNPWQDFFNNNQQIDI